MMFNIKNIVWLLVVAAGPCLAQEQVLTLQEILARIDSNNISLKIYDSRAQGYKYSAQAKDAWMAPMVGLGTFQTPYPGQMKMEGEGGMLMLRAEQDIPNRSKQKAQQRYILSQGDVEKANRAVKYNDLRSEAKRQYYTWLVTLQKLRTYRLNQEVLEMMRKVEEVRYPYNQSALSGVYRAEAALQDNRAMTQMQLGVIDKARRYLASLMNQPDSINFTIDSSLDVRFTPAALIDTAVLSGSRQDIARMNESIRSMQLNIEAMRLERKPEFKLQFDHMAPFSKGMPQAFSIMAMMSLPTVPWSSRMYKSEIKAMEYNIQAMQLEKAAMLQESKGMLYSMQADITTMQKRINAVEQKVIPALQKIFDAEFINYQENKLALAAVLSSWEALNMMRLEVLEDKQKMYQMIVDYERELFK